MYCVDCGFDGPEGNIGHNHPFRVAKVDFALKFIDTLVPHERLLERRSV